MNEIEKMIEGAIDFLHLRIKEKDAEIERLTASDRGGKMKKESRLKLAELKKQYDDRNTENMETIRKHAEYSRGLVSEIERLKALPSRVVDADVLKKYFRQIICPPQIGIEGACAIIDAAAIPQPDYMGAIRTLAKMAARNDERCELLGKEATVCPYTECVDCRIAYALAHPTEEGKP